MRKGRRKEWNAVVWADAGAATKRFSSGPSGRRSMISFWKFGPLDTLYKTIEAVATGLPMPAVNFRPILVKSITTQFPNW